MPQYTFSKENEYITIECSSEEIESIRNQFEEEGYFQEFRINISSGVGDSAVAKTDDSWKDVLRKIKKNNRGSTIDV